LCNLFGGQKNFGIWDAVHGDSFNRFLFDVTCPFWTVLG
jgi:hypothetical protein